MLHLNDIYHPKITKFYSYSLLVSYTLASVILIPTLYIILTQSQKAKTYKYLLIYQILWSYGFCTFAFVGGFVQLLPIPAWYVSGVLKIYGVDSINIIVPVYLILGIGLSQAYFLTCCYRVVYA